MRCPLCGKEMEEVWEEFIPPVSPEEEKEFIGFTCRNDVHSRFNGEEWHGEVSIPGDDPTTFYQNGKRYEVN